MKRVLPILLTAFFLLFSATEGWCLPACPGDYSKTTWTNCKGMDTNSSGKTYVGEWKNGRPHGQGTSTDSSGKTYVGQWKNGHPHGLGTTTDPSGMKYVGEYKDGNPHGYGTYYYSNGDKYVGEIKKGVKDGQGTYIYADGDKYVGEYRDNKRHGEGVSVNKMNAEVTRGIWKNGILIHDGITEENLADVKKQSSVEEIIQKSRERIEGDTDGPCVGMKQGKIEDFIESRIRFEGLQKEIATALQKLRNNEGTKEQSFAASRQHRVKYNALIEWGRGRVFRVCFDTTTLKKASKVVSSTELLMESYVSAQNDKNYRVGR